MSRTPGAVDHSPTEIDKALTVLAYYGGNAERASRDTGIPGRTLRDWRTTVHRERYLEICEREAPRLEAMAAQQARELIVRSAHAEHAVLDRLANTATEDEPSTKELSELAGALQRLTTSKGINTTKLLELTGRPTQIVEHRDPKQDALALARQLGIAWDATTTAEDITPSALPPGNAVANVRDSSVSSTAD